MAREYQTVKVDAARVRDEEFHDLSRLLDEGWRVCGVLVLSTRAVLILGAGDADERPRAPTIPSSN